MVTCEDFYEKFEKVGNFCQKSEEIAKQIEKYIDYRKRNRLESYQVNRSALYPFMMIEDKKEFHKFALFNLRKKCKKIGGKNITRRLSIEIINMTNQLVSNNIKIDKIPSVRSKMGTFEHTIEGVSFDVRKDFDVFKESVGAKNNDEAIQILVSYCKNNTVFEDFLKSVKRTDTIKMVKRA